ncbi:zinc ribbon domain-containing protein [Paraburkholderia sediminicola]|uniref:zinc ribbon domain-containing protein n=1 Tax=Paraburkholderia sediminicola TaxID=458836 RepID=UPI0038BACF37
MGWLERILGGHHGRQGERVRNRTHGHGPAYGNGQARGHVREDDRHHAEAWGRTPPSSPAKEEIACAQCGTANAIGARFCNQCATSLVPTSCSKCSNSLAPGAKFCGQCGTRVAT